MVARERAALPRRPLALVAATMEAQHAPAPSLTTMEMTQAAATDRGALVAQALVAAAMVEAATSAALLLATTETTTAAAPALTATTVVMPTTTATDMTTARSPRTPAWHSYPDSYYLVTQVKLTPTSRLACGVLVWKGQVQRGGAEQVITSANKRELYTFFFGGGDLSSPTPTSARGTLAPRNRKPQARNPKPQARNPETISPEP